MNSGRVTFEHKARLKQILTCVSWENTTHPRVHHTHTHKIYLYKYVNFFTHWDGYAMQRFVKVTFG